jgi:hypothetical protein
MAKGLLSDEEELRRFNAIESEAQPWYAKALPMEGRATFLPFRDSMPGSVFNKREFAVPGLIAEAANAITAPARSLLGTDPEFSAGKEGVNMAFNVMGGGMGSSRAMRNPTGEGGVDLAMSLFNTEGLPNKGADLIQSNAERLAKQLKENGFQVSVEHSGSKAGPSSYLQIYDPETGRFINNVRMSGHSKGVEGSANILNVATPEEMQGVIQAALDMRSKGPTEGILAIRKQEQAAAEKRRSKSQKRKNVIDEG